MREVHRVGDLEINEDIAFQRRSWNVERVGWWLVLLFLLAAAVGLLGPGLLSQTSAGQKTGPLWVEYDRFLRIDFPAMLRLRAVSPQPGPVQLWLSSEYVGNIKIEQIQPEPDSMETSGGRVIYTFRSKEGSAPVDVVFHFTANKVGRWGGEIGLADRPALRIRHFVYP